MSFDRPVNNVQGESSTGRICIAAGVEVTIARTIPGDISLRLEDFNNANLWRLPRGGSDEGAPARLRYRLLI